MTSFLCKLKEFNALSCNPGDHFKLCGVELRLCSMHPRLVVCTIHDDRIRVDHIGPASFTVYMPRDDLASLLDLLRSHRDDDNTLFDWEVEDWVSAGYGCRMCGDVRPDGPPPPWDLCFAPSDLWSISADPPSLGVILERIISDGNDQQ